eukprot:m.102620 g.102620  ORF g.102620 m.102620 type:complete len:231 (+) comp9082_c0_seq1:132-824(+)
MMVMARNLVFMRMVAFGTGVTGARAAATKRGLLSFPRRNHMMLGGSVLFKSTASLHTSAPVAHFAKRTVWKLQKDAIASGKDVPEYADDKNVFGCRRNIKTSPWKLNLVAKQIRNLAIDEAITQMTFSNKKAAESVRQVLTLTKQNALVNHDVFDPSNMYVAESYVGKAKYGRGVRRASRGRAHRSQKFDRPFQTYNTIIYCQLKNTLPLSPPVCLILLDLVPTTTSDFV